MPPPAEMLMTARTASSLLDRFFGVRARGSSIPTEVRGGLTTFVVMSYILVVNPTILSTLTLGNGPDFEATATMTAPAAGVATLAMGLYANHPFALASGLGLNAFVAFDLILGRGIHWQAAMKVVFIDGTVITVLVLTGLRTAVMPFTFSITNGIGAGCVMFTFPKVVRGRWRAVHWLMYAITLAFLVYFSLDWIEQEFVL
jgi:AGZA family xanthine/uracil permease-like MFS transporter